MKLNFDGIHLKKCYESKSSDNSLTIWGDYFVDVPSDLRLSNCSLEELQKLNFDGAYIAYYRDVWGEVVFRGCQDLLFTFYCCYGDTIYFSDDYYELARKYDCLTWNLNAVSDYFEDSWNNIAKYDRTPLKEIHKLDTWSYMFLDMNGSEYRIGCWKNLQRENQYTIHGMEAFKKAFFEVMDYYLLKIHDRHREVAIPVSGGIDANLIAARWSMLFPNEKTDFFTSKVDDITDESQLASSMQKVITSPIHYIPIKMESEKDLISLLKEYIERYLPPRFFNEINERQFIMSLWKNNIRGAHLNGMGADGQFGDFGGEYLALMYEKLCKFKFIQALNIYKAITISFQGGGYSFKNYFYTCVKFYIKKAAEILGYKRRTYQPEVVKVPLPQRESEKIKSYEDAIRYAQEDGAGRVIKSIYRELNMDLYCPFSGYRFTQLAAKCDPYIFSKGVNKYCLRYAGQKLLPEAILENKVKRGNPGITLKKMMDSELNKKTVEKYLVENGNSLIIDSALILKHLHDNCFDQKDFLGLSLLLFQERIGQEGARIVL